MLSTLSLSEAIQNFDRASIQPALEAAEIERQTVIGNFPIDVWPTLPLERYALGLQDPTTYCRLMEFGTPHLGSIAGGSAQKHLIFKWQNKEGWFYDQSFYSSVDEAWFAVRAGFVEALRVGAGDEWGRVDEIKSIYAGPALRTKTLATYYPESFIQITSADHLLHYLKRLEHYRKEMDSWERTRLNKELTAAVREYPGFLGWSLVEIAHFLYTWADPRQASQVVKIATGENGEYWSDCVAESSILVEWDRIGDLSLLDRAQFAAQFSEHYGDGYNRNSQTIGRKAKELWRLVELKPGDIIVANQGTSRVLGIGIVEEPGYVYRADRARGKHTVRVRWEFTGDRNLDSPQKDWAFVTVKPVSDSLYSSIRRMYNVQSDDEQLVPVPALYREIGEALERKGQAILYGPPGTGKTYHVRRFAQWWLAGDPSGSMLPESIASSVDTEPVSARASRRLWWVVANPSQWHWDRLFEAKSVTYRYGRLHRNYSQVEPGDLVVGYLANPDKRIAALARVTQGLHTTDEGDMGITLEPVRRIADGPTYLELQEDPVMKNSEPMRFRCQGTLFALTDQEASYLGALIVDRDPSSERALDPLTSTPDDLRGDLTWLTFHPSYSYEDFIEGFRPVEIAGGGLALRMEDGVFKRVCSEALADPDRRYLIVVDEINRANLAKVFGELLTLLEKDKRGLKILLPQSKETFTIPPNVFLLGTMNTADRSIKLMDAALRRRFAFVEIMPDTETLSGARVGDLELDGFLDFLNGRIAQREGREKQIGHAYLLSDGKPVGEPEEFARRFRQEILPLLQEYCYDDYGALSEYLGTELVDTKGYRLNEETLADAWLLIAALRNLTRQDGAI